MQSVDTYERENEQKAYLLLMCGLRQDYKRYFKGTESSAISNAGVEVEVRRGAACYALWTAWYEIVLAHLLRGAIRNFSSEGTYDAA